MNIRDEQKAASRSWQAQPPYWRNLDVANWEFNQNYEWGSILFRLEDIKKEIKNFSNQDYASETLSYLEGAIDMIKRVYKP